MSTYPKLSEIGNEDLDSLASSGDESTIESDDDLESGNCYYDEYGELLYKEQQKDTTSQQNSTPENHSNSSSQCNVSKPSEKGGPKRKQPYRCQVTLRRDAQGRLGIKLRRMGTFIYFAYVQVGSPAAEAGIGFGDQLLELHGCDLTNLSGNRLMQILCRSPVQEFKMTIGYRPYDFDVIANLKASGEMEYYTKQGKKLGSIKIIKVLSKGQLKHLNILAINDKPMLCRSDLELAGAFKTSEKNIRLRVMPRVLFRHLLKRQDKSRVRETMHLSNPP